jgi:hypothetical protein
VTTLDAPDLLALLTPFQSGDFQAGVVVELPLAASLVALTLLIRL